MKTAIFLILMTLPLCGCDEQSAAPFWYGMAYGMELRSPGTQQQRAPQIHCRSFPIGNTIYTDCR